jgi:hypothetical protein
MRGGGILSLPPIVIFAAVPGTALTTRKTCVENRKQFRIRHGFHRVSKAALVRQTHSESDRKPVSEAAGQGKNRL